MDERASKRAAVDTYVRCTAGDQAFLLFILDLSPTGCMTKASDWQVRPGESLTLHFRDVAPQAAEVVWRRQDCAGLQFLGELDPKVVDSFKLDHCLEEPKPPRRHPLAKAAVERKLQAPADLPGETRACPTCRRPVTAKARYCRACYTVLRPQEDVFKSKPSMSRKAALDFLALVLLGLGVWLLGSIYMPEKFGHIPNVLPWSKADVRVSPAVDAGYAKRPLPGDRRPQVRAPVRYESGSCVIQQRVRNIGTEAVERVTLLFVLVGQDGKHRGRGLRATTDARIAKGGEADLDFQVPCQPPIASAIVAVPNEDEAQVKLVPARSGNETARAEPSSTWVTVKVPAPYVCPAPDPCDLTVRLSTGGTTTYVFQRDSRDPSSLRADDSILVAHLQGGGTATIVIDSTENRNISLSAADIRSVNNPGFLAWLRTQLL